MKIKISRNFKTMFVKKYNGYVPARGRTFEQPSKTVPDQTMSLRTILDRYARGLPISGNTSKPLWEGEEVDPLDFNNLDLAEREELINQRKDELAELSGRIARSRKKKTSEGGKDELGTKKDDPSSQVPLLTPSGDPPSTNIP